MPVYYKALIKNGYELEPSPIRCGGEGSIFLVQGNSSIAAKVYSHGNAPKEKLYQMLKMPLAQKSDYIAWPQDILFNQTGTPAGFIMKRFSYTKSLAEMLSDTSFQWKKRICVAANLCDVVHEIHQVGQCIGDMNPSNFGVDTRNGHVCAFDADSFHLHDTHGQWYPCVVGIADYWPPELQRLTINGAELRSLPPARTFSQSSDQFALAVLIFQLLFSGYHPFAARRLETVRSSHVMNRRSVYILNRQSPWFSTGAKGTGIPKGAPDLSIVPDYIKKLFYQAFMEDHRPQANTWHQALIRLLGEHDAWGVPHKTTHASPFQKPVAKTAKPVANTAKPTVNTPDAQPKQSGFDNFQLYELCYLLGVLIIFSTNGQQQKLEVYERLPWAILLLAVGILQRLLSRKQKRRMSAVLCAVLAGISLDCYSKYQNLYLPGLDVQNYFLYCSIASGVAATLGVWDFYHLKKNRKGGRTYGNN